MALYMDWIGLDRIVKEDKADKARNVCRGEYVSFLVLISGIFWYLDGCMRYHGNHDAMAQDAGRTRLGVFVPDRYQYMSLLDQL